MNDPVIQTFALGMHWPTLDPFLFCAHHHDNYPKGNDRLGPSADLDGRQIGMDFDQIDGWNMYHGQVIPGFPSHPHRGFETITYVRRGVLDHSDSLGATARFGDGDMQWITSGQGIQHAEMFPLLREDAPNPLELFQIWLNLPAASKMVAPHFTMYWGEDLPVVVQGEPGSQTRITVIAGALGEDAPPTPPPNSWASRAESKVAVWKVSMEAGAKWKLPAAVAGVNRAVYLFDGADVTVAGHSRVGTGTGLLLKPDEAVELNSSGGADLLLLQGAPIGEPVAQHGPFVMNSEEQIGQAYQDYRRTQFGGWPWESSDPVHPRDAGRFALRPGQEKETPPSE